MGLETRNESSERPEQIERAKEQDTIQSKRMELNDSDFDDVDKKANKYDLSEVSEDKKDTFASEKEGDFSDVKENGQKAQEDFSAAQEKHRIAAEDFAEPKTEAEQAAQENFDNQDAPSKDTSDNKHEDEQAHSELKSESRNSSEDNAEVKDSAEASHNSKDDVKTSETKANEGELQSEKKSDEEHQNCDIKEGGDDKSKEASEVRGSKEDEQKDKNEVKAFEPEAGEVEQNNSKETKEDNRNSDVKEGGEEKPKEVANEKELNDVAQKEAKDGKAQESELADGENKKSTEEKADILNNEAKSERENKEKDDSDLKEAKDKAESDKEDVNKVEPNMNEGDAKTNKNSLTPGQIETHNNLESIAHDYVDKEPLTKEDKQELSDRQLEYLKSRDPEDCNDCRVFSAESIKSVELDENGNAVVVQDWKNRTDGAEQGSREMEVVKKGTIIDRIGNPDGKYSSPLPEDGKALSGDKRATGDRYPEQPIEKNSCYHKYEVLQDLTHENIVAAIHKTYPDISSQFSLNHDLNSECMYEEDTSILYKGYKEDLLYDLDFYYADASDISSESHPGDVYKKEEGANNIDGVKKGVIAPMFSENDGGGEQYLMPFTISEMCKLGLLREV